MDTISKEDFRKERLSKEGLEDFIKYQEMAYKNLLRKMDKGRKTKEFLEIQRRLGIALKRKKFNEAQIYKKQKEVLEMKTKNRLEMEYNEQLVLYEAQLKRSQNQEKTNGFS